MLLNKFPCFKAKFHQLGDPQPPLCNRNLKNLPLSKARLIQSFAMRMELAQNQRVITIRLMKHSKKESIRKSIHQAVRQHQILFIDLKEEILKVRTT